MTDLDRMKNSIEPAVERGLVQAWELGKRQIELAAAKAAKRVESAWAGVGECSLYCQPQDLIDHAWVILLRDGRVFRPGDYGCLPQEAAARFFIRVIENTMKSEVGKARRRRHAYLRVIPAPCDPDRGPLVENAPDPDAASDGAAMIADFLLYLEKHDPVLCKVAECMLEGRETALEIAAAFNRSEGWARNKRAHLRALATSYMQAQP